MYKYTFINIIVFSLSFDRFGRPLRPGQMGYPSLVALLQAIPDVVQVNHRTKRFCLIGADSSVSGDGYSSFDDSFNRSYRSQNGDSVNGSSFKDTIKNTRSQPADQFLPYNNHLKMDSSSSGRRSESLKRPRGRSPPPPPLYLPSMNTPGFTPRGQEGGPDIFTFDRPTQLGIPAVSI